MAIKKGSAKAKAWGAKMRRLRNSKNRKKRSPIIKLKAKRRMVKRRKSTKRRSVKRSASILGINTSKAMAAAIYGALRSKTSNLIAPYVSKLPLGNVADEAGMLAVSYFGKKMLFKKAGLGREVLNAAQIIELARIGEAVSTGSLGINLPFGNSNAESSSNGYNFA